jgi:hypothetical protein
MEERSRIRFNPVTKEIEVEGSEAFVRRYFDKLQQMLEKSPAGQGKMAPRAVGRPRGTGSNVKAGKETQMDTIVRLVESSAGGIATSGLKEKTGLSERQIWSIVYRAQQKGKIKKTKRGLYVAA